MDVDGAVFRQWKDRGDLVDRGGAEAVRRNADDGMKVVNMWTPR